jgi:hypothetical protein
MKHLRFLALACALLLAFVSGCQLIVDFDRGKIKQDAGMDGSLLPDGNLGVDAPVDGDQELDAPPADAMPDAPIVDGSADASDAS